MGEMADFTLDQVMSEEEERGRYFSGHMYFSEAFDMGIIDELGFTYSQSGTFVKPNNPMKRIHCRCCGSTDVKWKQVNGKWLLHEGKEIHKCPVKPLKT
jgi:hypothetical protein